jgi:small subunit ribosomal protein S20
VARILSQKKKREQKKALKMYKITQKKQKINSSVKSELKTLFKKASSMIEQKIGEKADSVKKAIKAIDSAAGKGIVHKNQAARKKSRLMKKLNKASV